MNQNEYLTTIFGTKYKLSSYDVNIMAAVLAEAHQSGVTMNLAGAPLLWNFEHANEDAVYDVVSRDRSYWGLLSRIGGTEHPGDVYNSLMLYMTLEGAPDDVKKVSMILLTEWAEGKELSERPRHQISPASEEAPRMPTGESLGKLSLDYAGWLASGKFPVEIAGEHEGETTTQIYDLDQKIEGENVPAVVQFARLLRATWSVEEGYIDPHRLESMAMLMARLFEAERNAFEIRLKEASKPAKPEPANIWPKDESHWLFDARHSMAQAPWPLRADYPARKDIEDVVRGAARFAVSRASGMGTSRVFNIEGFVENVVLGLFGDGTSDVNFDFDKLVFRKMPVVDAQPAKPAEPAAPAPVAAKPAAKPATKAAVKPADKPARTPRKPAAKATTK